MKVTAEDVAQLLASSPPRQIPAHVAKAAGGRGLWVLLVVGFFFGGIGTLFVFIFFPWRFMDDWQLASDAASTTPGIVTNVRRTSLSINKTRVMEYGFNYTPVDGHPRQGRCFTTGSYWPANAAVTIHYLTTKPDVACIEGARLSEGGLSTAFVILFPLIGGGLIAGYGVNRRNTRRLLHEGLVTEVDVVSVTPTNTSVNNQRVYKIVIASPVLQNSQPVSVRRSNPPDVDLALKHLRDKQPIYILYDARNPRRVLFPEALIDNGS